MADFVYTDPAGVELGILQSFSLDLAYGSDENDFELTVPPSFELAPGAWVYEDGTEWGGTVDSRGMDNTGAAAVSVYRGRTWHGIMAASVVCPPAGESHYEASGEANAAIAALVGHQGLDAVFSVSDEDSGIQVHGNLPRYCDMYSGIRSMLAKSGARLSIEKPAGGKPVLSAVPARAHVDDIDSDRFSFRVDQAARRVNHLVCLGSGEMEDRNVLHLYANVAGEVSQTQTLFGADEVAAAYELSSATADELLSEGTSKLEELQEADTCDLQLPESAGFAVGDYVGVLDVETGLSITAQVTKVVVRIDSQGERVSYGIGEPRAGSLPQPGESGGAGGAGGFAGYEAGDGIVIDGLTIKAEVSAADLAAVAPTAIPDSWIENLS